MRLHRRRFPSERVAYSLGCRDAAAGHRRSDASIPALLLPHYEDGYVAQTSLQAVQDQRAWSRKIEARVHRVQRVQRADHAQQIYSLPASSPAAAKPLAANQISSQSELAGFFSPLAPLASQPKPKPQT